MQRGRKRIDWEKKAINAGFKSIEDAFDCHISSGGIYTTKNLAYSLNVSNMSLLLKFKQRGKRGSRAGAPSGNTNNKFDLRCDLFGFDNDDDMLKSQMDNFFQTSWAEGITEETAKKITNHLNGTNSRTTTSKSRDVHETVA